MSPPYVVARPIEPAPPAEPLGVVVTALIVSLVMLGVGLYLGLLFARTERQELWTELGKLEGVAAVATAERDHMADELADAYLTGFMEGAAAQKERNQ